MTIPINKNILIIILFFCCFNTIPVKAANTSSTLLPGTTLSAKMKTIANNGINVEAASTNTNVKAILKANSKPNNLTDLNIISTNDSEQKTYMWYENESLFFYSNADTIYLNNDSSYAFRNFKNLTDISGLEYFDSSQVSNMEKLFINCINLSDLSPITNWDTSNVTNMHFTFGSNYADTSGNPMKISDISFLKNWNVSKVTTMNSLFEGCVQLKSLNALTLWDTSNVTDMTQMFNKTGLTDASDIKNWNINNVTNFYMMLANIPSTTIKPIFTYRSGIWENNGTYRPNIKKNVTITVTWNDISYIPNNIKIHLKKEGEIAEQISNDANWIKNNNTWTYVFYIYDSANYYIWEEDIDGYINDASQSSPKLISNYSANITNTLNLHSLTLKNLVSGNMASIYNNFEYTINLYDKNNNPMFGNVLINSSENITLVNGSFTKNLKHDDTLTINNIPHGYKYKIVLKNTDYLESYTINVNSNISNSIENIDTGVNTINDNQTITFVNNKEEAVKTGINSDFYPLILLFFTGVLGFTTIKFLKIN